MKCLAQKLLSLLALLSVELVVLWAAFFGCLLLFLFMANEVFGQRITAMDEAMFRFADRHTSPLNNHPAQRVISGSKRKA